MSIVSNSDLVIEHFADPIRRDRNCFGGGVMIYVSNSLQFNRRNDLEFDSVEMIWLEIKTSCL